MTARKSGIVCVGMVCVDVLARPVDHYPENGKLVLTDQISLQIGGCAANAAIGLARIGTASSIVGKIGNDNLGNILLRKLQEEKVDTAGLIRSDSATTSSSLVMINSGGERSVIHSFGTNGNFCFEDIDTAVLQDKKIMLIAGTFLMPSFDGDGTRKMLQLAKRNGLICCMDTAWDATGTWIKKIGDTLEYLDWFMPSCDEARELSGKDQPQEMSLFFNQKGAKNIIIKLGSEGCYVKEEGRDGYFVPAYTHISPVDASGAGDAFCAGFIAALQEGWEIARCAVFANAVAAHCIMQVGTTAGIPSKADVLHFVQQFETGSPV